VCYIGQGKFLNLDVNCNNINMDIIGLLFSCWLLTFSRLMTYIHGVCIIHILYTGCAKI
jgi:hypothetical protein